MLRLAAAAVAALVGAFGLTLATDTAPEARLGVYQGPGKTGDVDRFQAWLGRTQVDATDYADPAENVKWNGWMLGYWGQWKKAKPDRRFVLGVHLVPEKDGTLAAGLKGSYDEQFKDLGALLVKNGLGDSTVRLGYEPNNPGIGPWQGTNDPGAYKAMYRRAHDLMRSKAPGLKFDYNLAVGPSGKVVSFDTLYPGDGYVDYVGLNVYDVWWKHPTATPAQRWTNTMVQRMGVNEFRGFAAAHSKPYSFPEWGLYKRGDNYAGGGDNPYFIDRMREATQGAAYQAYFNWNWGGGVLDNFPNGKARYKEKFHG
ncbi:hypothetical protein ACFWPU_00680 [Streptomyces sp. NPDC058471]|uniref:hypothetical protein n=1 Tax=Streptomyces sp. NPDC058471 TaxID=3346516 RepID=UPI0036482FDE